MDKKFVPNDVFKFRVCLNNDLNDITVTVYVKSRPKPWDKDYDAATALSLEEMEQLIEDKYFTKERIAELKKELIKKIEESDNPFDIYCTDYDGDYNVTEDELFNLE